MEEVTEVKYSGTVLCKHGTVGDDGQTSEGQIGAWERDARERSVSMEVQRGTRNTAILPTLSHTSESGVEDNVLKCVQWK